MQKMVRLQHMLQCFFTISYFFSNITGAVCDFSRVFAVEFNRESLNHDVQESGEKVPTKDLQDINCKTHTTLKFPACFCSVVFRA